jgi:hypothetical protein
MDEPHMGASRAPRATSSPFKPGTYLRCSACGRLLKIEWATRSIVCACGARVSPSPPAK